MHTVVSRALHPSEWSQIDSWIKLHGNIIGLSDITWLMDRDDLCFRVCITIDSDEEAAFFKLSWG